MTVNNQSNIEAQAREWVVKIHSDDVDGAVLQAFQRWRLADSRHEQAFLDADRHWQGFRQLDHLRKYITQPTSSQRPARTNNSAFDWLTRFLGGLWNPAGIAAASVAMVVVAVVGVLALQQPIDSVTHMARYATGKGEVRDVTLDDGSIMTLGAQSQVVVEYSEALRQVTLAQGEVLFDVEKNPERPFVVNTGETETRVLGTVFLVDRYGDNVTVAVKEGRVRVGLPVNAAAGQANAAILTPGHAVAANLAGVVGDVETIDIETIGSWKEGRLVYENARLEEIIEDANKYFTGQIVLADKSLAEERLSISFGIDNIEQMIDDLTVLLPLVADKSQSGTVVLQRATSH